MNILINNKTYKLTRPPLFDNNLIELHFDEYNKDMDFTNGYLLVNDNGSPCMDTSAQIYKYNVITECKDGIVLTDDPEVLETEDNLYSFRSDKDWDNLLAQVDADEREAQRYRPLNTDRLADLEEAICAILSGENMQKAGKSNPATKLYFNRICVGLITIDDVPKDFKADVINLLEEHGLKEFTESKEGKK